MPHYFYINTPPILLLGKVENSSTPSQSHLRTDYHFTSPDSYPRRTILCVFGDHRKKIGDSFTPGKVLKLRGVRVSHEFEESVSQDGTVRLVGRDPTSPGHGILNVFRFCVENWFAVGTEYDPGDDALRVKECRELYKRWLKDEEKRKEKEKVEEDKIKEEEGELTEFQRHYRNHIKDKTPEQIKWIDKLIEYNEMGKAFGERLWPNGPRRFMRIDGS